MIDQCNINHVSNQAKAIKGNGTYNDLWLFNGIHLTYSISNFFNQENEDGGKIALDFTLLERYEEVKNFNNGVFINLKDVKFYSVGEKYQLPIPKKITGYSFKHYTNGIKNYKLDDFYYITDDMDLLSPVYIPTDYTVKFYDDINQIESLNTIYNIEMELILETPTKEGYNFLGWYDNEDLVGDIVDKINFGGYGSKSFYAKWEKLEVVDPGPTDEQLVSEAQDALALSFASGDSVSSVTKNLTLPTSGINDAVITWASSNTGAISNAGVVVRAQANANVTLTATIKVGNATLTKVFNLTVKALDPVVDPTVEYTITFNLNGGAWPTTGGTPGYTNRNTMMTDFLTDWFNFLKPAGVTLNDFMHGKGKTSGFDGLYAEIKADELTSHFYSLYAANTKGVDASTGKFINQPQYNKWVPLIDLFDQFVTAVNPEQNAWGSLWTGIRRIKGFVQGTGYSQAAHDLAAVIPAALKGSTPGVAITVPSKYKTTDEVTLPNPTKASDNFLGWYDNSNYEGSAVTKINKGSTGNKVFYARYASTVVPEKPLTDAEKMALAKAALAVGYSSGDNANSVKGKVTLAASGLHGVAVTWSSSNTAAISNAGAVVRNKDNNVTVTLTATLKLGSLTETKAFTLTVIKEDPVPVFYKIEYTLNGGSFSGYTNKTQIFNAFTEDLHAFVNPGITLTQFRNGHTWYTNEDYRAKIYAANVKSGNNNYFLSSNLYQAKWKPLADFMINFVKVGNAEQDFWSSPYTGLLRLKQYFANEKPGGAWDDAEMNKLPLGLVANVYYQYDVNTPTITLPTVTRNGYDFEGWYTANTGGTKVTNISKGSTGDKMFYARWKAKTITITLNKASGTGGSNSLSYTYGSTNMSTLSITSPTRSNYKFLGYYTSGGTKLINANGSLVSTLTNTYFSSNTTLTAKWETVQTVGDRILAFARTKVGGPYVWGGNGPTGYDCSGLTMAAYAHVGITIPRIASDQYAKSRKITASQLRPGDLVFWGNPGIYHVAIWVGNGKIVHAANSTTGIVEANMYYYDTVSYGTFW